MKSLKIGTKLILGFLAVVAVFVFISGYQLVNTRTLLRLEEEAGGRAADALEISLIEMRLDESYSVIADGIINRNMDETHKNWQIGRAHV